MTIRSVVTGNNFKIVIASVIVAIITLRDADCLVSPGLDTTYRWALNYMLAFNRSELSRIIYPEGPLCILKWPAPVGDHILICAIFQILLNAWFVTLFSKLYRHFHTGSNLAAPILVSTVFLMVVNVDYICLGCVLCGMLLWKYNHQKIPLYIGALITVLALYTKSSFFVLCTTVWFIFAVFLLLNKEYKVLLSAIACGIFSYLLTGLLIFGSISRLSLFTSNNILQPFSYTDALSLYPDNNWIALSLMFLLILSCFIIFFREPAGFLLKLLGLCFFANWKYAIGREDFFHALSFAYLLVLVLILFVAIQKKYLSGGVLLLLLSICSYNYSMKLLNPYPQYFWFPGFVHFSERVIHHKEFKQAAIQYSEEACKANILPVDMRAEIGNATTDVFPWDLSIVMVNKLNYKPRPYFQSPPMDAGYEQKDIRFFQSAEAPQYLIWHTTNFGQMNLDGLNSEYLPNEMPLLTETILANYSLAPYTSAQIALYRKRTQPLIVQKSVEGNTEAGWGEWVPVPRADTGQLIEASVSVNTSMLYSFMSFIYKGSPLYIEYEKNDGSLFHFRFSVKNVKEGIFINPLWNDPHLNPVSIKRIRFSNEEPKFFPGKISITWKRVRFAEQR